MSAFQNNNQNIKCLEILMDLYRHEFIQQSDEETQRVNPTGSEDTARRDESSSKILRFEDQTRQRVRRNILHQMNEILSEMAEQKKDLDQ